MRNKTRFQQGLPTCAHNNPHAVLSYESYVFPYELQIHALSEKNTWIANHTTVIGRNGHAG